MDIRMYRDVILRIIAEVTKSSTNKIWGGTKIDQLFNGKEDDLWLYWDFCERLEKEFAIKISEQEQLQVLGMRLLELENFLSKKQCAVS